METTEARMLNKLKELKDALSQTILTNFTALDERVDQFSELVSDYNNCYSVRWTTIWKRYVEHCRTIVKYS